MGTGTLDGTNPLSGILGSILGESPDAQKARIDEATRNANDVSGLIKRKKGEDKDNGTMESRSSSKGAKRRAISTENGEEELEGARKRVKE